MILEYQRPETLEAALELLARQEPRTVPLGGGTILNQPAEESYAVVDLQALGLDGLHPSGNSLQVGAMVRLAALMEQPGIQPDLAKALGQELNFNLRHAATAAGALVSATGRSGYAVAMLALDAELELRAHASTGMPAVEKLSLGDLLTMRQELLGGRLISQVRVPLHARLAYEAVSRTPADLPILCAAVAQWSSGRTRVALGGFGDAPTLVMDGPEPGGAQAAAMAACWQAEDAWASAEYRQAMAGVLVGRCLEGLTSQ